MRDRRRDESANVYEISRTLFGLYSASGGALLDSEHLAAPTHVNCLTSPNLRLSVLQTSRELERRKIGKVNASEFFQRTILGYRRPGDSSRASRAYKIPGFAGVFDALKKKTTKAVKVADARLHGKNIRTQA